MDEDIERQKKLAEIDKLKAEAYNLNHPFAKPATWLSLWLALAAVIAGAFATIAQWRISDIALKEQELTSREEILDVEEIRIENLRTILKQEQETSENAKTISEQNKKIDTLRADLNTTEVSLSEAQASLVATQQTQIDYENQIDSLEDTILSFNKQISELRGNAEALQTAQLQQETSVANDLARENLAIAKNLSDEIRSIKEDPLIIYYKKPADGERIEDFLRGFSLPFDYRYHVDNRNIEYEGDNVSTNAIYCGEATKIENVRALAHSLLDDGVKLQHIRPTRDDWRTAKDDVMYILTLFNEERFQTDPVLTREQIDEYECE